MRSKLVIGVCGATVPPTAGLTPSRPKRESLVISLLCVLCVFAVSLLWGDTVVLKDGSQISGEVIDQKDGCYKIITKDGKNTVERIVDKKDVKAIFPDETDDNAETPADILREAQATLDKIKALTDKDTVKEIESIDNLIKLLQLLRLTCGQKDTSETTASKSPLDPTSPITPTIFGEPITVKRVVFVLDTSSSMGEAYLHLYSGFAKISKAQMELIQLIKTLPEDFYFNIILFNGGTQKWQKQMMAATEDNKRIAIESLSKLKVGGPTDLRIGLGDAIDLKPDIIYIISDMRAYLPITVNTDVGPRVFDLPTTTIPVNWVYLRATSSTVTIPEQLKSAARATGGKVIVPEENPGK